MPRRFILKTMLISAAVSLVLLGGCGWYLSELLARHAPVVALPVNVSPVPADKAVVNLTPHFKNVSYAGENTATGVNYLFKAVSRVDEETGPHTDITFEPTTQPCVEPDWLEGHAWKIQGPSRSLKVSSEASWCLRLAPGQVPRLMALEGTWKTSLGHDIDIDTDNLYVSLSHASGKSLALRAVAAGYCPDDSDACSATAWVELSLDDKRLMFALRRHGRIDHVQLAPAGGD